MQDALCGKCQGTGYVLSPVDGVPRAHRCACWTSHASERRIAAARIPRHYAQCSLESFAPHNDSLLRARRIAEEFVLDYVPGSVERGLLLLGAAGRGKTHLAVSILTALIAEKGVQGLFFDFGDLLKTIQASWNKEVEISESEVLDTVTTAEVLLLDDLGATRPSLWVQDILFHILNARYSHNRVTLLTSNHLDPRPETGASPGRQRDVMESSLEHQIGTRLRSRLYEMCRTIEVEGEDFRKTVKHAEYHARR